MDKINNLNKVCRSCMEEKPEMNSLFNLYDLNKTQLNIMFKEITNIHITNNEHLLPNNICKECKILLIQAFSFKTMCQQTDRALKTYLDINYTNNNMETQTYENNFIQFYNCGECQKKFKSLTGLERHCKKYHDNNSIACVDCGNLYENNEILKKHLLKCHESDKCKIENVFGDSSNVELKKESARTIRVKEEPIDHEAINDSNNESSFYHDEDDEIHSDYFLHPIKEEQANQFNHSVLIKQEKKKKKSKKNNFHSDAIPENHPCSLCPRVFASRSHLEAHEAKHAAKSQRYTCSSCNKSFSRFSHLKRHELVHVSEVENIKDCDKCVCPHCPKIFLRSEDLEKHMEMKHNEKDGNAIENPSRNPKVAFCNVCNRGFTTQRYLEIHMKSHRTIIGEEDGVQGFPCKSCEHVSENKVEARAHTQWHRRAERPFLCSECGQGFTRDAYLTVHMRRHRGEKPFSCTYCGKGFPRRSDLDIHERYHTEDKRHTCAICGKAFHRQYNLKVHLRVHTGERPYACPYCPKAFTQPNDLKAHVRRHTGERFTCEICSAQFLHGYHLTQHRRTVHAVDKPSHIRRLSKFPSAGPPHPPTQPHPPPTRGRARQAHIQLAAHMASILAAQQQQQQQTSLTLSQPPPAS